MSKRETSDKLRQRKIRTKDVTLTLSLDGNDRIDIAGFLLERDPDHKGTRYAVKDDEVVFMLCKALERFQPDVTTLQVMEWLCKDYEDLLLTALVYVLGGVGCTKMSYKRQVWNSPSASELLGGIV